jgi:hypothetical protein
VTAVSTLESGQKRVEALYQNGEIVELEMWDEEGNPVPSPSLPESGVARR